MVNNAGMMESHFIACSKKLVYVPPNEQKVMELLCDNLIPSLFVHLAVHKPVFLEQAFVFDIFNIIYMFFILTVKNILN